MKNNKFKIKYIPFIYKRDHDDLKEDFRVVDNPTTYSNVPDGEYVLRGNKKSHATEYWVIENTWYLVSTVTKDNGHWAVNAGKYMLFPNLSEKEWDALNQVFNKLSTYWQRMVMGRNYYMDLRTIRRNVKRFFIEMDKSGR